MGRLLDWYLGGDARPSLTRLDAGPQPVRAARVACLAAATLATVAVCPPAWCQPAAAEKPAEAEKKAAAEKPVATGRAGDAAAKKRTAVIAQITLAGSIPDGVGQGGLLADLSPHLHRVIERLDKAAADSRVKGVVLTIESPSIGRGRAAELRAAIGRIRKAGKPVAAHLVGGQPAHYMVTESQAVATM